MQVMPMVEKLVFTFHCMLLAGAAFMTWHFFAFDPQEKVISKAAPRGGRKLVKRASG